jgi:hypothetical protein
VTIPGHADETGFFVGESRGTNQPQPAIAPLIDVRHPVLIGCDESVGGGKDEGTVVGDDRDPVKENAPTFIDDQR